MLRHAALSALGGSRQRPLRVSDSEIYPQQRHNACRVALFSHEQFSCPAELLLVYREHVFLLYE